MLRTIKTHWREFLIEAWCLGTFMVSACLVGTALFHSSSPVIGLNWYLRNAVMGIAMGLTAIGIVRSSWGQRSGAHFNPAVTLAFWRLGRISSANALFYSISHFVGGSVGVLLSWAILGDLLADGMVNFVVTIPGSLDTLGAFVAETAISFGMMTTVLFVGDSRRLGWLTPYLAGCLLAIYIAVESPISGTSLNPARTFASALVSGDWRGWWVYVLAPPIAMLAAAELFHRVTLMRERRVFEAASQPQAPSMIAGLF